MTSKIGGLIITWVVIVFLYIVLAASMPGINDIISEASAALTATSNMTNYPGTKEAIDSAPVWLWFIPGGIGFIATVVMLKKD